MAVAYVDWGLGNPGPYQLLFESADQLGPDWAVVGAADQVTERLAEVLSARTGERSSTPPEAVGERLWTRLHGLVSLRVHKPEHVWANALECEVARLLEHVG